MELVIVVIAVAVLGLASMVAVGKFGEMQANAVQDRYEPPLPAAGPIQGKDLAGVQFATSARGYDMAEVDQLMARMARELDERDRRAADAASANSPAEPRPAEVGPAEPRPVEVGPAEPRPVESRDPVSAEPNATRRRANRWRGKDEDGDERPAEKGGDDAWAPQRPGRGDAGPKA
ncbi:DivIVA domain-containing protein [Naumannella sp. ID2617S]|nr:DivIVA domain-containing protein [Naumannella sp. ID2617S]